MSPSLEELPVSMYVLSSWENVMAEPRSSAANRREKKPDDKEGFVKKNICSLYLC